MKINILGFTINVGRTLEKEEIWYVCSVDMSSSLEALKLSYPTQQFYKITFINNDPIKIEKA